MIRLACLTIMLAFVVQSVAQAGEADVENVRARQSPDGTWSFSVSVAHGDEGWDHYSNKWDVIGADGTVYGERILHHPHVDEQPFTRSQSGIAIPKDVTKVIVRAHDSVHGLGGREIEVDLTAQ